MSEHGYRQVLPGEAVSLELEIKYPRMHLREAGVVFRHEQRAESELRASGPVEDKGARGGTVRRSGDPVPPANVARLSFSVPGGTEPGVYRAHRLWVETYGGRVYEYEGEEVDSRFAFEVLEEPDEKPELALRFR